MPRVSVIVFDVGMILGYNLKVGKATEPECTQKLLSTNYVLSLLVNR